LKPGSTPRPADIRKGYQKIQATKYFFEMVSASIQAYTKPQGQGKSERIQGIMFPAA